MPEIGAEVSVTYLGATMSGVVRGIDDGGRRVDVEMEDGRLEVFTLNRATARFTADGSQTGARLRFPSRERD